jgi:hypothetical protein
MCPDDGAVDHLQHFDISAYIGQRLQQHIPNAGYAPSSELSPDQIPIAEFLRQVAPRCARARDPENRIEHPAMVTGRPTALLRSSRQERLKKRPFAVRHQAANQG